MDILSATSLDGDRPFGDFSLGKLLKSYITVDEFQPICGERKLTFCTGCVGRKLEEEKICFSFNIIIQNYTTQFKAFSSQFVTESSSSITTA